MNGSIHFQRSMKKIEKKKTIESLDDRPTIIDLAAEAAKSVKNRTDDVF